MPSLLILVALLALAVGAQAQEFRVYRPIRRHLAGSTAGVAASPVDERVVVRALERLVAQWNTPALRAELGRRFYDGDRLADNLAAVPRDARLRLLAVEAVRIVRQQVREGPPGTGARLRVSQVSVVARTQVELEDALAGFRSIEGTNEYVFELSEPLK